MLKLQNILWIEDNPDTVWTIAQIEQLSKGRISFEELLSKTTLAPDYKSAKELLQLNPNKYDLIILDADFPDEMSDSQRESVQARLKNAKLVGGMGDLVRSSESNTFVPLYLNHIEGKVSAPVVVHSVSRDAPYSAFMMGLPFFSKSDEFRHGDDVKEKIEERDFRSGLWQTIAKHKGVKLGGNLGSIDELNAFENKMINLLGFTLERYDEWIKACGGDEDLISRYFIN
jgi:hypothetical protein